MKTRTADICVIGAGSAGLTVAAAAANFGHDVVLIERHKMGGDCLNYGCVPSKSLIAAAKHAAFARDGARFGIHAEPTVDFSAVHNHVHGVVAAIAPHDSEERFEGLGVTVISGHARVVDGGTVEVDGTRITAKRFVIATGSRPVVPPIEGLADVDPLTNESVFDLTALPASLAVVGGGPIGCELGQAFARLGAKVTIATDAAILPREDPDASAVVRKHLEADGVTLLENAAVEKVSRTDRGVVLTLQGGHQVEAERVLVAVGRAPNVEDMGLDTAGVETTRAGVTVDKGLRTSNRRIFAIGDVTGGLQFTHVAGYQASLAVRAIVFRLPVSYDPDLMPRATFTSPEVAQVGLTLEAARARYGKADAYTAPLSGNDRAQAEGETDGFLRLITRGGGKLVGATIVAPNAGDLISTYAMALAGKVPLKTIASFTPAYPTIAEAGKRAAVSHFGERLDKGWIRSVLRMLKLLP
ncbi:MAG: FAD-dependent oxidoreductase [Pseudomonadota bacterium]